MLMAFQKLDKPQIKKLITQIEFWKGKGTHKKNSTGQS